MFKLINTKNAREKYLDICQKFGAFKIAPSRVQGQFALFAFGVVILSAGLMMDVHAQGLEGTNFNDDRIANSVDTLLTYLEGSFGALVMVVAGIGAILSSAFGQYRAALGCLVVAVGAFILRSFLSTFFNTESVDEAAG